MQVPTTSDQSIIVGDHDGPTVELQNQSIHLTGLGLSIGDDNEPVIDVWRNFIVIDNCSIIDFPGWGIRAYDTLTVDNCTFDNGTVGFNINNDDFVTVKECVMTNLSYYDAQIYYSQHVTFRNNTLDWYGLEFGGSQAYHFDTHTFDNTTLNGLPIGYFPKANNFSVPSGYSQVILANCQDATVDDLTFSDTGVAVQFYYCDRSAITDCVLDNVETVSYFYRTNDCSITGVVATNVTDRAFRVYDGDSSTFFNVTAGQPDGVHSDAGIEIQFSGGDTTIENSTFVRFSRGISTLLTDYITISNCTFDDPSYGMWIRMAEEIVISGCNVTSASAYGFYIDESDLITITNNSLSGGDTNAMRIEETENSTIAYNEIFNNNGYGIYMWDCENNDVHHNNFDANSGAMGQGYDNTGNNTWDDNASEGNYWSDWDGNGSYQIGGSAAEDRYPFSDPVDTDAPRPIPEFPVVTVMAFVVVVFAAVFRRRRVS
jgi:parallel beta-helix repeat protein